MDWNDIFRLIEVVIIPVTAFLIREIQNCRKDLSDYKVYVAQNYASGSHLLRLEVKIDELKDLMLRCRLEE
ncbi:unknown [Acetobacter sp. CAG:977]|nr:unknown [Acetobacter sp. CAG:977]DAI30910.1 MAG TPA: hypothetical protein [Caudoviricetes sp.]DAQ93838.1 MAG TPA: hypothetical protein [Caudoviricetes sp.]